MRKIPGVNWIVPRQFAYSDLSHRYSFSGSNDKTNWRLYTIDANTGEVLYSPPFPFSYASNETIYDLVYSDNDDKLYGLLGNNTTKGVSLVVLDPHTAQHSVVNTLAGVFSFPLIPEGYMAAAIDKNTNRYLFIGSDSLNTAHLFTVDISSGKIISSPLIAYNVTQMAFDDSLGKIVALYSTLGSQQLISVDPATASITTLCSTGNIKYHAAITNSYAYNKVRHEYTFAGSDSAGKQYLTTLGLNGDIRNQPDFRMSNGNGSNDNLICFHYDNNQQKLFAIHWEAHTPGALLNPIAIYPNPFSTELNIVLNASYTEVTTCIKSTDGKLISRSTFDNTGMVVLQRSAIPSGIYLLEVYGDGTLIGERKLLIE